MAIAIVLLIGSMLLFLWILAWGLPMLLLRPEFLPITPTDRGVRRCYYRGHRCIVYETSADQRFCIRKYLLCQEDGYKLFKCQLAPRIHRLAYDIVLFDRCDRIIDVVSVKENLLAERAASARRGQNTPVDCTGFVELPDETSYVKLVIRRVNGQTVSREGVTHISRAKLSLFAVLALVLTALEGFAIKVSMAHAFGGVFREDFISSGQSTIIGIAVTVVLAAIGIGIALSALRHRNKK